MNLKFDKSFERDARKLPIDAQKHLKEVLEKLMAAQSLQEVGPVKMHGSGNAYRIRFGDYRIGIYLEGDGLILSRVLNRKDIYKFFPPH